MSTKLYGSLINRINEGKQFVKEIKVGDGVTETLYSDRHAYEVIKVINQKHIIIRRLKAIRTDKLGMSDTQNYKYESDKNAQVIELSKRGDTWYRVDTYTKEKLLKRAKEEIDSFKSVESAYGYLVMMCGFTEKQYERLNEGKEVKKYNKMNLIIGTKDEYYDYSF